MCDTGGGRAAAKFRASRRHMKPGLINLAIIQVGILRRRTAHCGTVDLRPRPQYAAVCRSIREYCALLPHTEPAVSTHCRAAATGSGGDSIRSESDRIGLIGLPPQPFRTVLWHCCGVRRGAERRLLQFRIVPHAGDGAPVEPRDSGAGRGAYTRVHHACTNEHINRSHSHVTQAHSCTQPHT